MSQLSRVLTSASHAVFVFVLWVVCGCIGAWWIGMRKSAKGQEKSRLALAAWQDIIIAKKRAARIRNDSMPGSPCDASAWQLQHASDLNNFTLGSSEYCPESEGGDAQWLQLHSDDTWRVKQGHCYRRRMSVSTPFKTRASPECEEPETEFEKTNVVPLALPPPQTTPPLLSKRGRSIMRRNGISMPMSRWKHDPIQSLVVQQQQPVADSPMPQASAAQNMEEEVAHMDASSRKWGVVDLLLAEAVLRSSEVEDSPRATESPPRRAMMGSPALLLSRQSSWELDEWSSPSPMVQHEKVTTLSTMTPKHHGMPNGHFGARSSSHSLESLELKTFMLDDEHHSGPCLEREHTCPSEPRAMSAASATTDCTVDSSAYSSSEESPCTSPTRQDDMLPVGRRRSRGSRQRSRGMQGSYEGTCKSVATTTAENLQVGVHKALWTTQLCPTGNLASKFEACVTAQSVV